MEKSAAAEISWEGVDPGLFEALRQLRLLIAQERGEKPYMVFGDAVLRELARVRPSTPERMRYISGVGDVKLRDFAGRFLPLIASHSREHGLAMDVTSPVAPIGTVMAPKPAARMTVRMQAAHDLYRNGASIDDVMRELKYARTTAVEHLAEFIRTAKPASIATWVSRRRGAARDGGGAPGRRRAAQADFSRPRRKGRLRRHPVGAGASASAGGRAAGVSRLMKLHQPAHAGRSPASKNLSRPQSALGGILSAG